MNTNQLEWVLSGNSICITGCAKTASIIQIPSHIDHLPVTSIQKKAFWGSQMLTQLWLPDTLTDIGDWAFASCRNLKIVTFANTNCHLGKRLFSGDEKLLRIECTIPGVSYLLAIAATQLHSDYLLDFSQIGTQQWFSQFDDRLLSFLQEPDENLFNHLVISAEEGMREQFEAAILQKHIRNGLFCMFRLQCNQYMNTKLTDTLQTTLKAYAAETLQMLGASHPEWSAWIIRQIRNTTDDCWESFSLENCP